MKNNTTPIQRCSTQPMVENYGRGATVLGRECHRGRASSLIFLALFWVLFAGAPVNAQPREVDQQFTEIDLLFDILQAVVTGTNVDDPEVLATEYPSRAFSDFDRDRDGQFMSIGGALGLFDLTLGIAQFNHDSIDADGDGLLGFIELECRHAAAGLTLDPTTPQTTEGVPDGAVDCDGDGVSNLDELSAGTNPLLPDGPCNVDRCGVCDNDPDNDCVQDCVGVYGGPAVEDNCGFCDDNPDNDCVQDCAGVWGGEALEDACGVCDDDPGNDCSTAVAERVRLWVCNQDFANELDPSEMLLTGVTHGSGSIGFQPAEGPCQFDLFYYPEEGDAVQLSEQPGAYVLAAAVERDGLRSVCVSRIDHIAADDGGEPDPDGAMVQRQTTGVVIQCAQGDDNGWSPLQTVVATDAEWAGWVLSIIDLGPGSYRLKYDRDFSFQFLNLTQDGRPDSDGTYTVDFFFQADGQLVVEGTDKLADEMAGAPTATEDECPPGEFDPSDPRCAPRCGDGECNGDEVCGVPDEDGQDINEGGCSIDCSPCSTVMDDAHDPGYAEPEGVWATFEEGNAGYSRWTEDGIAVFSFPRVEPGWKEIWVTFPQGPDRTALATYSVVELDQVVARFTKDQSAVAAAGWHLLGVVKTHGDFTVSVTKAGAGRLYADAIRVDIVEEPESIIDDGDGQYQEIEGEWQDGVGGNNEDHRTSIAGTATFSHPISPGTHEVSVRYPVRANVTTRAKYTVLTDGQVIGSVLLDQNTQGDVWISLGRYRLNGAKVTVRINGTDNLPVMADAVRIEARDDLIRAGEILSNDRSSGYLEYGAWFTDNAGNDGGSRGSQDDQASATWQFAGIAPDFYDVLVQYPVTVNNSAAAEYVVRSASGQHLRVVVDQRQAIGNWLQIGRVRVADPVVSVSVRRLAGGEVLRADAIKLVSTRCAACER